jgi:hypothetical protein
MTNHELKCHPHFFAAIVEGKKTFEIRRDDRKYSIGDTLTLKEYDPSYGYTGAMSGPYTVVYIMMAEDFPAILPGFVIMGLGGLPEVVTEARPIGEVVAELPVVKKLEKCNAYREIAGLPYSKASPCGCCHLGQCAFADEIKADG